jgi:hypothetical protein
MGNYDGMGLEVPSGKPWREAYAELQAENAKLLLQIREWENAVNQFCYCGGGEPGHGCAACDMYHFVKGKTNDR